MVNVVLASLPIAIVVIYGAYHLMRRRQISMADYLELPQPGNGDDRR